MKSALILHMAIALLFPLLVMAAVEKRPMTIADLFRFQRISDPQISPDGQRVVCVVTSVELEGNKTTSALWLASTAGGEPRPLTNPGDGKKDRHPRWSPDGQRLLFESTRSGDTQLWLIELAGGEARQITRIASEAANASWSPDGKSIAFVSAVWPEYSDKPFKESNELHKKRKEEMEKNPVKAKVFTRLFFRHWDSYVDDKRQHLFVMAALDGEPRDVTPGNRDAYPTSTTFSVGDDFTFSPDSKYLIFTAVPEKDEAWNTNYDLCRVALETSEGRQPLQVLTRDNAAADGAPRFSPDGRHLAYRSQKRAGYEADKWEILVVDTDPSGGIQGKPRSLTAEHDRSAGDFVWAGSNSVIFAADEDGRTPLYQVFVDAAKTLVLPRGLGSATTYPWAAQSSGTQRKLQPFSQAPCGPPCTRYAKGHFFLGSKPGGFRIHICMVPPATGTCTLSGRASSSSASSLALAWLMFRARGSRKSLPAPNTSGGWLMVALVNAICLPSRLTDRDPFVPVLPIIFGQKFVDEISGDWGGKCYDDLMKGVAYMEQQPYIDPTRLAAAGASFGGYMMNWFAVNTGKFKCLITHCSVWNFESMYATTDELWFDEWEHGGPPWGPNRHSYEKHSPHRLAGNLGKFKTPMLVIHNDLDFRCPIGQGHELFATLQRQGVPSRFINFPDEGHWVTKPKNSEYWHKEVFSWLTQYCPPGGK